MTDQDQGSAGQGSGLPRYPSAQPRDPWSTPPPQPGAYYPPGSMPPPRSGPGSAPDGPGAPSADYARYWARVAGFILDSVIVWLVSLVYLVPTHAVSTHRYSGATGRLGISDRGTLVLLLVEVVYNTLLIGLRGQTLGMMAVRIKAVDATSGELIGVGRALGRDLVERVLSFLFLLPLLVDLLFPVWDSRRQTLHDKAVGSVVVRV